MNELYITLMSAPFFWTLDAIDEMDIEYYLDLLNYQSEKEYQKNVEEAIRVLG